MSVNLPAASVGASLTPKLNRIYKNDGNTGLISLLDSGVRAVLDVGCGAGDNAELIRSRFPACEVYGITHSEAESEVARCRMTSCSVWDIEANIPADFSPRQFDAIIFSHVLEHTRNPEMVLQRFISLLRTGGSVLIAVPNALSLAMRWQFLRGDFEYQSDGVLDDTHLRFFTYFTTDRYLLSKIPELRLVYKGVTGSVPQWWLRRYFLPTKISKYVDRIGCRYWPNLFGGEVLLKAVLPPSRDFPRPK